MSPMNELYRRIYEHIKEVVEIICSPCFLFIAFMYSILKGGESG